MGIINVHNYFMYKWIFFLHQQFFCFLFSLSHWLGPTVKCWPAVLCLPNFREYFVYHIKNDIYCCDRSPLSEQGNSFLFQTCLLFLKIMEWVLNFNKYFLCIWDDRIPFSLITGCVDYLNCFSMLKSIKHSSINKFGLHFLHYPLYILLALVYKDIFKLCFQIYIHYVLSFLMCSSMKLLCVNISFHFTWVSP